MIIWRGWGILAVFITAGVIAPIAAMGESTLEREALFKAAIGIGLIVAGAANGALGHWLNTINPRNEAASQVQRLRAELWRRVNSGEFQVAPGAPAPSSQEEATQQVEQIVLHQTRGLVEARSNIHTLFFIPIQWVGAVEAFAGVVMILMAPFTG
ncbi:hypothetical protein ACSL103130_07055 [Actinomyces slackii]|uniref:Uncharacterized protein n=1 Tax=Actinomyces slackii TaxID=52774 RepID=A0A3S4SRV7_9ACTO|nr:hypothetical protein [Actinomyces slackii]VEG73569.1 Uncharacterised protein [Actinomyces slackii]